MADEKKYRTAILSSGKVNRYGYRLLVEGVKLASFIANPLMLYVHRRSSRADNVEDTVLPIGKWDNIRVEDGKLLADPNFDMEDEFAAKIARKWEMGYLNATSVNHTFDAISEDETLKVEGQTRVTVTSWEILEASIVDVPGDPEAVKLNFKEGNDPLSKIPLLAPQPPEGALQNEYEKLKTKNMDLKKIALLLGLSETATEADVENRFEAMKASQVENILALGRQKGVVNDGNIAGWRSQVTQNPEFARLSWEGLADVTAVVTPTNGQTLAAVLKAEGTRTPKVGTLSEERKNWTLKDWRMKDYEGLLAMEETDPTAFDTLVKSGVGTGKAILH